MLFLASAIADNDAVALIFLLGLGLATALHWLAKYSDYIREPWPTLGRVLGYSTLIGAAIFGTWQTWSAITDILAGDFF